MGLALADITVDHAAYAAERDARRAQMIPVRRERRVVLGDLLGLEFESVETLRYQTQEMVHTERLTDPAEVEHEIAAYSRMLPTHDSVSATLFVYLSDERTIRSELERLQGVHKAVAIEAGGHRVVGEPIPTLDSDDDETTVSVHMLRFRFSPEARAALLDPAQPVLISVEHPAFSDEGPMPARLRELIAADLTG